MSNYLKVRVEETFEDVLAAVKASGMPYEYENGAEIQMIGYQRRTAHLVVRRETLEHWYEDVGWVRNDDGTATMIVSSHQDHGKLPTFLKQVETLLATKVKQDKTILDLQTLYPEYQFEFLPQANGHTQLVATTWK